MTSTKPFPIAKIVDVQLAEGRNGTAAACESGCFMMCFRESVKQPARWR